MTLCEAPESGYQTTSADAVVGNCIGLYIGVGITERHGRLNNSGRSIGITGLSKAMALDMTMVLKGPEEWQVVERNQVDRFVMYVGKVLDAWGLEYLNL